MNDKVFVKESYKILEGTAVFNDGSVDEIKNVQVYSKINVDPWVEELQAENEQLKGEVRKWKRDSAITSAMFRLVVQGKECTSTKVLEEAERVENLEKKRKRERERAELDSEYNELMKEIELRGLANNIVPNVNDEQKEEDD